MNEKERLRAFHEALRIALEVPNTVDEICLLGGWTNVDPCAPHETLGNNEQQPQSSSDMDADDSPLAFVNRAPGGVWTAEARIAQCRREIASIEVLIRSGHSDLLGLCRALLDWNAELRLLEKGEMIQCHVLN